jgi:hypothetical protein
MDTVTITITAADVDHLRLTLREQLAGDHELVRHLTDGPDSGRWRIVEVAARIAFLDRLADDVGGLF